MSDESKKDPTLEPIAPASPDEDDSTVAVPTMDRRRFLGGAALGAAGLALGLKDPESAFAQQESADVTVDGILLTILSAPLGSVGSSTWTVTQSYASTFSLQAAANTSLSLSASVTDTFGNPTTGTVVTGSSSTFSQSNSVQVSSAITIHNTITLSFTTPSPGIIANTVFLGILSPKLNFKGNPSQLLWKFVNNGGGGGFLALTVGDLLGTAWHGLLRPSTHDAWLAQYPLISDPSGSTLVKPRFKKRYIITASAGVAVNFSVETADGTSFSTSKTASFSAEITNSTTFMDPGLKITFQVGNKLTITMTSVQEITSSRIIKFSTVLQRSALGTFIIYRDRVYKTWMVVDGGPPAMSGQPVVRGVVNGDTGTVIAGALVTLTQGTQDFVTATDGAGNYLLATPPGASLATGTYPIVSGNVSQNVNVTSGTSYVNFYNVNGLAASSPHFLDSGLLE